MKATEMTTEAVERAARDYDNVNNEGCTGGYNPYRAELQRRAAAKPEKPASKAVARAERIYQLSRELEKKDSYAARESLTYDAEKIAALKAEIAALEAEQKAEIGAELVAAGWTREHTAEVKAKWNAMAKTRPSLVTLEKACGCTIAELKKASDYYSRDTLTAPEGRKEKDNEKR